jgi:hypothetical protein
MSTMDKLLGFILQDQPIARSRGGQWEEGPYQLQLKEFIKTLNNFGGDVLASTSKSGDVLDVSKHHSWLFTLVQIKVQL